MGAAVALQVPVSRVGDPPLAWTWIVEDLRDLHRLNVERFGQWAKSPSSVAAGGSLGWPLGDWRGLRWGALTLLSGRPLWRCLGWGSQPPPHSFGAGCQGFHHVTDILPIQGNSCPFTQLLAGSIQVKWSTGGTRVDHLVPNETTAGPLGQALVLVTAGICWGPGTMPSAVSAFTVSRRKDGALGSKSHSEKVVELGCAPRKAPAFWLWWWKQGGQRFPPWPSLVRRPPHSP